MRFTGIRTWQEGVFVLCENHFGPYGGRILSLLIIAVLGSWLICWWIVSVPFIWLWKLGCWCWECCKTTSEACASSAGSTASSKASELYAYAGGEISAFWRVFNWILWLLGAYIAYESTIYLFFSDIELPPITQPPHKWANSTATAAAETVVALWAKASDGSVRRLIGWNALSNQTPVEL